jgi:hypothetical protein
MTRSAKDSHGARGDADRADGREIEELLRAEGKQLCDVSRGRLHARIMSAVRRAGGVELRRTPFFFSPAWAALATAFVAATIVVAFLLRPAERDTDVTVAMRALSDYGSEIRAIVADAPAVVSYPIEREVRHIEDDLERTARFLLAKLD